MKLPILILSLVIVVSVSCRSNKTFVKKPIHKGDEQTTVEVCESIKFTDLPFTEIETDYYQVDSLFITGSCLNIWISYSGGCGDSEFALYFNNRVMESMPPKASLMLTLSDKDNCRAIVQQKLTYNISFFDNYAEEEGIKLRLAGVDSSVLYKH